MAITNLEQNTKQILKDNYFNVYFIESQPEAVKMPARNYDQLNAAVDRNGGFYTCEMAELRDVHGAGKLGVNVIENISETLDHRGLGHTPNPLPLKQWMLVRVYRRGSPVGKLINAAIMIDKKSDEVLSSVTGTKETEIIRKIRELVCD